MQTKQAFQTIAGVVLLTVGGVVALAAAPENEKIIQKFCERASVRDRGMVHTPFAGAMDDWAMVHLLLNEPLRKRMRIEREQMRAIGERLKKSVVCTQLGLSSEDLAKRLANFETSEGEQSPNKEDSKPALNKAENGSDSTAELWLIDPRAQKKLTELLTEAQRDQLDLIYLHLEGLIALVRPHLSDRLALTAEQHKKIIERIQKCKDESVLPLHRAYFTLQGEGAKDAADSLRKALRKQAYLLDSQIAEILQPEQVQKLSRWLQENEEWEPMVVGPGLGGVTIKQIEQAGAKMP